MNEQLYIYRHNLTKKEIKIKYPYSMVTVDEYYIKCQQFTITFDVLLAYEYLINDMKVVIWGGFYQGMDVFVFDKPRIQRYELPF